MKKGKKFPGFPNRDNHRVHRINSRCLRVSITYFAVDTYTGNTRFFSLVHGIETARWENKILLKGEKNATRCTW